MHQAFQHLGCTNQAAQANVDQQGINSLEELCFLLDEDVETLCRNVKHPGGQTLAGGANLSANAQRRISNLWLIGYIIQRKCLGPDKLLTLQLQMFNQSIC